MIIKNLENWIVSPISFILLLFSVNAFSSESDIPCPNTVIDYDQNVTTYLQQLAVSDEIAHLFVSGDQILTSYFENPKKNMRILRRAENDFKDALELIEEICGPDHLLTAFAYRELSKTNWAYLMSDTNSPDYLASSTEIIRRNVFEYESAAETISLKRQTHYTDGIKYLTKIVELYSADEEVPKKALFGSYLELADWYNVFGKYKSANKHYIIAYNIAKESDKNEINASEHFGKQTVFYALDRQVKFDTAEPREKPYWKITFEIRKNGSLSVKKKSKIGQNASNELQDFIRDTLKTIRFRPAIEDSKILNKGRQYTYFAYDYPAE